MTAFPVNGIRFHSPAIYLLIGQSRNGYWVAQANDGSIGGIFASKSKAMRFAADEKAVAVDVPTLELEFQPSWSSKKEPVL